MKWAVVMLVIEIKFNIFFYQCLRLPSRNLVHLLPFEEENHLKTLFKCLS